MTTILDIEQSIVDKSKIVLNGDKEELAWSKHDIARVVQAFVAVRIPVEGIDVWGLGSDGELEFANVFPPVWSRAKNESDSRYLQRSALQAEETCAGVRFSDGTEPYFSLIPSVRMLGGVVVAD